MYLHVSLTKTYEHIIGVNDILKSKISERDTYSALTVVECTNKKDLVSLVTRLNERVLNPIEGEGSGNAVWKVENGCMTPNDYIAVCTVKGTSPYVYLSSPSDTIYFNNRFASHHFN